ncbi:phage tail protein [Pseudomonas sp. B21-035]|uniref:phage tail protein n=1 Tax=Pseudomonas sp. B21-035 TaxID=2895484 RepID=UPI00215EEFFA|nr:DUF1983 domain-containing protein [Pseudomonas sp. B21-035]UVL53935.1 DUF1983 domain-containing protein [Pseudomonas sp. B21-035]
MSGGVKKLAQVVVGAVIGFVQGNVVGAVIGAGLAFYAAEQQEKLNTKSPLRDNEPSAQTVRSSKAPVRFILGRVATGGVLVWAQEQSGTQTEGEWLHLVYVLCEGSVDALEEIYLGEEPIASYGPFASYELVVNPTQVNAFLKANCPDWKDSQIGRGLSYVRLSLQYSAEKFPSGIPDARFVVRGRNDLYDPRTGMSGYSANTALHLLWYLRARCNVPDDEIVFETFASAANVCDESVGNADGSVSARYRTACVIGADEQKSGVLQKLEAACAGKLIRVGGRWMLQAGAYYGPYDFEITEDMVIGTIGGSTEPSNDAAINTVRGTFIDPTQSWTETDYPEVSIAEWVAQDGGEAAETLTFSYVTDPYLAQRLANIELRRRRAGGVITIPMNFAGYNCRPGRVVRVNLPSLNILGEFIVTNWSMGDEEGCNVQVQQYEAAIFDDAVGEPYNPIGFINLPSGGLGSPTGLAWVQETGAEVVQGVLTWAPSGGIVSEYAVIVRQGVNVVQSHTIQSASNRCQISGLPSGNYTMSVAAIGPMARSGEATINVSVNGPPIPEFCSVQSALESITLIPSNPSAGLNGGTYEYFFTTNPNAPSSDAVYLGQGLSFTHTGLAFFTNYFYYIRSTNAYGKSPFLFVPASTSNDVSAYLQALAGKITESELGQELLKEIEKISGDGPGSVNDRLEELNEQLQEQIGSLVDALEYNPEQPYLKDDAVRLGQRLYQAKQPVPADPSGANAPPNPLYWLDIGQVVQSANGLAAQVQENTAGLSDLGGVVTAQATSLQSLQAAWRADVDDDGGMSDANAAWDAQAGISEQRKVFATEQQASAERFIAIDAKVGQNAAGLSTLEKAVATQSEATATRLDQLKAEVDDNAADIQEVSEAQVTTDQAVASIRTSVEAVYTAGRDDTGEGDLLSALDAQKSQAKFASDVRILADADQALARKTETLEASIGETSASVQQVSQAVVNLDGKVSAQVTIKAQTTSGGRTVVAGLAVGSNEETSEILAFAQRFAVVDEVSGQISVPFVVQNGQVFINQAFISQAFIKEVILGSTLRSAAVNSQGLPLLEINIPAGTLVLRGQDANGSTLLNNGGLYVYDAAGTERTAVGRLTAPYVYNLNYITSTGMWE